MNLTRIRDVQRIKVGKWAMLKFAGSWTFWSISTFISLLSMAANSGALTVTGMVSVIIDHYKFFSTYLFSWMNKYESSFGIFISELESVAIVSVLIITLPRLFMQNEGKNLGERNLNIFFYLLLIFSFVFILAITRASHVEIFGLGSMQGMALLVFLYPAFTVILFILGGRYGDAISYGKNYIGALVILLGFMISGAVNILL